MGRRKPAVPLHLAGGLGPACCESGSPLLPRAAEEAPARPRKRTRVPVRPAPPSKAEVPAGTDGFGICALVFSSPQAYELQAAAHRVRVELLGASQGSYTQQPGAAPPCLLLTAFPTGASPRPDASQGGLDDSQSLVQVLLPVPSEGVARCFLRLVASGALQLSIQPCTTLPDLLEEALGNEEGPTAPASTPSTRALLRSLALASPNRGRTQAAAAAALPHVTRAVQPVALLPPDAVRLVVGAGVDVGCVDVAALAAGQPSDAGPHAEQACNNHGDPAAADLVGPPVAGLPQKRFNLDNVGEQDVGTWPAACWMSSRISALLLAPSQPRPAAEAARLLEGGTKAALDRTTGLGEGKQGVDEEEEDSVQDLVRPRTAPGVLLPSPRDGVWQLTVCVAPARCQDAADSAAPATGPPAGPTPAAAGLPEGDSAGPKVPDPEEESRKGWQDDLIVALRWLLPHVGHWMGGEAPLSAAAHSMATSASTLDAAAGRAEAGGYTDSAEGGAAAGVAFSASRLYTAVKPRGDEPSFEQPVPELVPELRPYQKRAVAWMLRRERGEGQLQPPPPALHPLWRVVTCLDGRRLFLNPFTGLLRATVPPPPTEGLESVRGGVLCDEMGLGKTVELLACILAHRFQPPPVATATDTPPSAAPAAPVRQPTATGAPSQVDRPPAPLTSRPALHQEAVQAAGRVLGKRQRAPSVRARAAAASAAAVAAAMRDIGSQDEKVLDSDDGGSDREEDEDEEEEELARRRGRGCKRARRSGPKARSGGSGGQEHIRCPCGYARADPDDTGGYTGVWVLCEACHAWQHGLCVGMKRAPSRTRPYTCTACLRAAALAEVSEDCGATLIVCPPAILGQWWSEINKHCKPGAVRVVVYSGQQQSASSASIIVPTPGCDAPLAPGDASGAALDGGAEGTNAAAARMPLSARVVSAADLAAADIVLTTYDALKRDLDRQPDLDAVSKSLRRQKRYEVVPTPLTRLRWWRVVLDEAQMVESSTAKATAMARKLDAVHRWCVTGTPISRGLEDVYGLLAFLQVAPWSSHFWWSRAIQRPCEAGHAVGLARLLRVLRPSLGGLMWRTAKADVVHELGIPPQHHHVTWLSLSAVERHFYLQQHQACLSKIRAALSDSLLAAATRVAQRRVALPPPAAPPSADACAGGRSPEEAAMQIEAGAPPDPASPEAEEPAGDGAVYATVHAAHGEDKAPHNEFDRVLTATEQKRVLLPLLRLRQAACHPQVGAGGIKALTAHKAPMTMTEILQVLISKAKVEAEEAQRALVSSLNGLAALVLLEAAPGAAAMAVSLYRQALQVIEANKPEVRTDPLQHLHTLHNLDAVLAGGVGPGVPRTLRDDTLQAEADAIRTRYLGQRRAALAVQQAEYDKTLETAKPFNHHRSWFLSAIAMFKERGAADRAAHRPGTPSPPDIERDLVDLVKLRLIEADTMRMREGGNASSITERFKTLTQLQLLLTQALDDIEKHRKVAMAKMQELIRDTGTASQAFVEQAGSCHRCRSELGQRGRLCEHCKADELLISWEVRLFKLFTRAVAAGQQVSAEEAARQVHAAQLLHGARGGLGEGRYRSMEEVGPDGLLGLDEGERGEGVTTTRVMWTASEAEQALKHIYQQFKHHFGGAGLQAGSGTGSGTSRAGTPAPDDVAEVLAAGKDHLERLEAQRKLFAQARALTLAQRTLLYGRDELEMAVARTRLRAPGEEVPLAEEHFRIFPEEIPLRNKDLTNDKVVAQGDLDRTLGTLRYLRTLQENMGGTAEVQHGSVAGEGQPVPTGTDHTGHTSPAPQAPGPSAAPGAAQGSHPDAAQAARGAVGPVGPPLLQMGLADGRVCPICHDPLGGAFAMLPCGHMVCCGCTDMLVARVPHSVPMANRKVPCPNCRARAPLAEISYVEGGGGTRSATLGGAPRTEHRVASDGGDPGLGSPRAGGRAAAGLASPVKGTAAEPESQPAPLGDLWAGEADVRVAGSYGTKIEAVMRRLLHVLRHDADAKVVVFSAWLDLLEVIAHALDANHVAFAFPKGRKGFQEALAAFKAGGTPAALPGALTNPAAARKSAKPEGDMPAGCADALAIPIKVDHAGQDEGTAVQHDPVPASDDDAREEVPAAAELPSSNEGAGGGGGGVRGGKLRATGAARGRASGRQGRARRSMCVHGRGPPRVLLLLSSQGGAGLNLTEAQHVVLVEPRTDPAPELQAVGRVHRIGQTRETHVHRFVVQQTVEENVHALGSSHAAAMDMSHASARATRQGQGQESAMRVCDVALLLATPWSAADPAGAHTLGGRLQPDGAEVAAAGLAAPGADADAADHLPAADVAGTAGMTPPAGHLDSARAAAAAAAEARWRQQLEQGDIGGRG